MIPLRRFEEFLERSDGVASVGGADTCDNLLVAPTREQVLAIEKNDYLSKNHRMQQLN